LNWVTPSDCSLAAAGARLRATGRAYVSFATSEPGLFRTAFTAAGAHAGGGQAPRPEPQDPGPFSILSAALDSLGQAHHRPFSRA